MQRLICIFAAVVMLSAALPVSAAEIGVNARSAILIDADDGSVLFEKDSTKRLPMASTTKIMTALVALEKCPLDREVVIPAAACGIEGSSVYLKAGERLTMEELLYALLLSSANDAATAIAIEVGGSVEGFAELMNEKVREFSLTDTHFTNPHGLDDAAHYTTAADLAAIAKAALANADFRSIVSTYRHAIGSGDSTRHLMNHNRLLKLYDDAIGVKTGFTKSSGRCLVSAAERDGVTLIAVTLSDPDDWADHEAMLDYGFSQIESVSLCEAGDITVKLPCAGGDSDEIRLCNRDALRVTMRCGHGEIGEIIEAPQYLFAPVEAGTQIGRVRFFCGGKEIGCVPLYAECGSAYIEEKGFFERLLELYR